MKNLTEHKKSAFTLAEVLITLGVIGIVAAMTIPTLISKYQEKVTVTKVKKMYSTLSNAMSLAVVDYGNPTEWGLDCYHCNEQANQTLYNHLKPYLRVSKECIKNNDGGCISNSLVKYLNGSVYENSKDYYSTWYYLRVVLSDSSSLFMRTGGAPDGSGCDNSSCGNIWYDVDGPNKGPNQVGRDIFSFSIKSTGQIKPNDQGDCYLNSSGWACASHIIEYGNMDYPATKSVTN